MDTLFTQFVMLPLELQREVWMAALDHDLEEAAVCIFSAYGEREPKMVDVDVYSFMHICRESRDIGRRHLTFRHQPDGPDGVCLGPCRAFRPELDTLYLPSRAWSTFFDEAFLDWWSGSAELQYFALDQQRALCEEDVAEYASHRGRFPSLRAVVIVAFSHSEAQLLMRERSVQSEFEGWPQYELLDFLEGETVWDSPPGRVRRQDIDPADMATWFQEMCSAQHNNPNNSQEVAFTDNGNARSPNFDTIPKKMVRKCTVSAGGASSWVPLILDGVRRLWQYRSLG